MKMEGDKKESQTETQSEMSMPETPLGAPSKEEMERANVALTHAVENAFESMWAAEKDRLKNHSKKELAHRMFVEGVRFMLFAMQRSADPGLHSNEGHSHEEHEHSHVGHEHKHE